MNSHHADLMAALDQVKRLFFLEMNQETTAYVYGSGATGDWSSARSDLDLIVLIKEFQLPSFLEQIQKWKSLNLPLIDGFLCAEDTDGISTLRLEDLLDDRPNIARPLLERILAPDLWKIQNRSKRLFGTADVLESLPRVSQQDLQRWATSNRDEYWIPSFLDGIKILSTRDPNMLLPLTPTIWVASGASRIANLVNGGECISKQQALRLFIEMIPASEPHIKFLIENYDHSDDDIKIMNVRQALEISNLSLDLMERTKSDFPEKFHV